MSDMSRMLLSGDEAIALAALHAKIALGTGYPGTPSTEILEHLSALGGKAQWAPNEKVALEVALGAAFAGSAAIVTMKHVGLNVAADPLFTAAYTGVSGALVIASADDPGMASSQNEQDNRRYAVAAGVPMLEPSDSQDAYDFTLLALEVSHRWQIPVLLRITTRVCHSKTVVRPDETRAATLALPPPQFARDIKGRVMIPAYARPAHLRLREKLRQVAKWNDESGPNRCHPQADPLPLGGAAEAQPQARQRLEGATQTPGIVTSGISYVHAREAAPDASILKLGMTYPLPVERIRQFAVAVKSCIAVEEGDPYLYESIRAVGIQIARGPEAFRFGELSVPRVRKLLAGDSSPDPAAPPGKPPQLCLGCPHRKVFEALSNLDCIVAGDIGCYTLGVLPPFERMDSCVCMGASIGVGLGMRHVLGDAQARKVVSVIGDSTFIHSGITGLAEMVYNPPATGHVVIILDNGTTAMTGLQEHPGTGRTLAHQPTGQVVIEDVARSLGIPNVTVLDPTKDGDAFENLVRSSLESGQLAVIIARRPCLLAVGKKKSHA